MDLALHDPQRGYYARRIRGVGHSGDFTTTPMLTPALGKAVGAWATAALRETACRDLIELGPGEGLLARAVLSAIPWFRRWRVRLHLVERSKPLREKQQALLGDRIHWHDSVEDALAACHGRACIYSNEFADAFPVRRFRRESDDRWSELHLTPAEDWRPCVELLDSAVFDIPHPPDQIVEVNEAYHHWLDRLLPAWQSGRMLTIDYGSQVESLYQRRPRGTLRAYLFQQRLEGPAIYDNPGRQDLTADVNFTDLQRWTTPGLETVSLIPQGDFLLAHAAPNDTQLIEPQGAGSAFLVLDQRRTLRTQQYRSS